MVDAFRSMLDELMGKERDAPLHARSNRKILFSDPDVCKHDLAAVCPHQLFKNTRSDLGPCESTIHSDHLEWEQIKSEWDQLSEREKERYGYERDLVVYLDRLIRDMDRKIEKNRERAAAESRPKPLRPDDIRKLDEIKMRMNECLAQSQTLGESGDVDGSMRMAEQAEACKRQHETLEKQLTLPDRVMAVCEVCGIFISSMGEDGKRQLSVGELRAREEHLSGKQYLGWKKIRDTFAELTAKRASAPAAAPAERGERSRSRGREEGERRGGSSGRERSRSPGRRDRHGGDRGGGYDRGGNDRGGYDRGGYDRGGYDRGGYDRGGYGRGGYGGGGYGGGGYGRGGYDGDYRRDRRY